MVAVLVVVGLAVSRLRLIFVPAFVAAIGAAFLGPPARRLRALGLPASLAAAVAMLAAALAVGGVIAALSPQVASDVSNAEISVDGVRQDVERWLVDGPLGLSQSRVEELFDQIEREIRENEGAIVAGAFSGALVAVEVVAGIFLTLVLLFFFLKDGERIWAFLVGLVPVGARDDVAAMGARGWATLGGWLRGTAIVALVDAVLIGLAIFLLGVPLAIPLAVVTFVGGFIPIIGATVAALVAVLIALVSEGLVDAVILLGAILAVQQLEGNILQPVVVGRNVDLHPVVVLVAVTTGAILWGVIGAFVAVPVAAAAWAAISYLRERGDDRGRPEPVEPAG